jgi:poly(hydroxyalkanoate) depolymerase family esterase
MLVAAALPASAMTLAAAAPTGVNSSAARPGTVTRLTYGSGPLAHPYLVYTPSGWRPRDHWPLLVMLHGCETTAEQQMQANLYNPLANKKHFVVAYPDTSPLEDAQPGPTARCWQFPSPTDWIRGQGDGAAVAAITKVVTRDWNIDSERVYVMGMSAGSFLSADLAAEYPDLYAASGENAGGAYADGTCLVQSVASLPVTLSARLAEEQMGPRARVVPRIVIGGDHDQGVPPACADKALMQGLRTDNLVVDDTQTAPISLTPKSVVHRQVPHGYSYTVSDYRDHHGCLVGQRYLVHGMNHFWSGGSSKPTLKYFTDPKGPSAAVASWKFFSKFTLGNTADPCRAPIRDDRSHLITRRTNGVHVTVAKRIGPRVIELTVKTPAFAQPTHVDVDLPVGYWAHPRKRWPVTYFLAGIMNTYASLNSVVDGVALTRHFPSIVVSPNGDSGWWSNWYNGGKGGVPEY